MRQRPSENDWLDVNRVLNNAALKPMPSESSDGIGFFKV